MRGLEEAVEQIGHIGHLPVAVCYCDPCFPIGTAPSPPINCTILPCDFTKSSNICSFLSAWPSIAEVRKAAKPHCPENQSNQLTIAGPDQRLSATVTRVLQLELASNHPVTRFCPVTSLNSQTFAHLYQQRHTVAEIQRATMQLVRDRNRQHQQLTMLLVSTVRPLSAL